ncbi:MAG: DUF1934 domain-containing protein [Ruminiclostridium sp.]
MTKDVNITIKTVQKADEEQDTTELFTVGKFNKGRDKFTVSYDESEATGFEGCTVKLEITDNMVTMTRFGEKVMTNLMIEKGRKHHCHYGTPYGDFIVGITADEIRSELTGKGGDIYLKYTIDINSSFMSENEMSINIKECGENTAQERNFNEQ